MSNKKARRVDCPLCNGRGYVTGGNWHNDGGWHEYCTCPENNQFPRRTAHRIRQYEGLLKEHKQQRRYRR